MHLNLLPTPLRKRLLLKRALRAWGMACGCLLLGMALFAAGQWHSLAELHHRHAVVASACEPIRQLQSEIVRLAKEQTARSQHAATLHRLESDGRVLRLLELLSQQRLSALEPVQVRAVITSAMATAAVAPGKSTAGTSPIAVVQPPWVVQMSGVAPSDTAVNELVETLRESGRFGRVELKSIANAPAAAASSHDWAIECHY